MTGRGAVLIAVLGALAAAAHGQTPAPADPIGDLLRERPADPDPAPAATRARPNAPALSRPVMLHETGRNPDAPPSPADVAYDSRLKSSAASARGFQGPMDGGWTLAAGGRELYALQLIDRNGVVEGAWRDLRRSGALDGSGYIDAAERRGGGVVLRLSGGAVAVVRPTGDGWAGELTEGGRTQAVTLARRAP